MNEVKWVKIGKAIDDQGTTITYQAEGTNLTVESRKRNIPHANGRGTWEHTSYFVLEDGKEIKEKHSLAAAKEYAEELIRKNGGVTA